MAAEDSPVARALARRLLLYEAGVSPAPTALADAADRAYARLRDRLEGVIGQTGFVVLVDRAVRLAQAEAPALEDIPLDARMDGGLHVVRVCALTQHGEPGAAAEGLAAILAHIAGLLVALIGEDLALRLVHDAWPELGPSMGGVEGRP